MLAYELLARLSLVVLVGQDEDGELEFVGTDRQWLSVRKFEEEYEKG